MALQLQFEVTYIFLHFIVLRVLQIIQNLDSFPTPETAFQATWIRATGTTLNLAKVREDAEQTEHRRVGKQSTRPWMSKRDPPQKGTYLLIQAEHRTTQNANL